jgi:hypothetical protein
MAKDKTKPQSYAQLCWRDTGKGELVDLGKSDTHRPALIEKGKALGSALYFIVF